MTKYFLKSEKNGKYLSSLFTDSHTEAFSAEEALPSKCYYYFSEETAKDIIKRLERDLIPAAKIALIAIES